jgi:hypothetical protein
VNLPPCSGNPTNPPLLQEDGRLIAGHAKHGNKWTLIAQLVGGRTDNAVKNRWAALCKKQASRRARGSDTSGDDADSQHAPRYSKDQPEVMGPRAAMIGSAAAVAAQAGAAAAAGGQPRRAAAAARHYDVYEAVSDSSTGSPVVRGSQQQQQQFQAQQRQQQQAFAAQHLQTRQPTAGGFTLPWAPHADAAGMVWCMQDGCFPSADRQQIACTGCVSLPHLPRSIEHWPA